MGPARSYSSPEWDEKSGSPKTNRQPLETDWIFWTFRNSGQNSGQKSTGQNKSTAEQQKALKTNGFQGFDGGDKRDRTADLLNAIDPMPRVGVEDFSAERKKCCSAMVFRFL